MENKVYYLIDKATFELQKQELDSLHADYVRIRFLYCGICGGDYSCFLGRRSNYPYTLGHEFVAEVVEIGKNVVDFSEHDFVVSDFNFRCNKCSYCLEGKDHLCKYNNIGYFTNRAYADYADVHYKYLYKILPLNNIINATLIEPLSCVIHAYEEIQKVDAYPNTVLIVGLGNIGMLFAFYLSSIIKIQNIFVYDNVPEKMKRVTNLFNCKSLNLINCTDYDFIIDATNTESGAHFCLNISRYSQKYCMMSHLYGLDTSFIYEEMCRKEIYPLFPLRNGNSGNIIKSMRIIKDYWRSEYETTMESFPITKIQQVFESKETLLSNKQIISIFDLTD
ncbi:alcohol dehydrogenase catalytic domain-containing protein [Blautia schinkii]|nr:alcohol dehydrogenase catalytic domain-containing protein [Blautia schinkii]